MSLEPVIVVTGYTPYKRQRRVYHFAVDQSADRSLPPHTPKTFEAKAPLTLRARWVSCGIVSTPSPPREGEDAACACGTLTGRFCRRGDSEAN
jgi:hypothetical protein